MQIAIKLTDDQKQALHSASGVEVDEITGSVENRGVPGGGAAMLKVLKLNSITSLEGQTLISVAN